MDAGGADGADMPTGAPTMKLGRETKTSRKARLATPASVHAKPVRQRIKTSLAEIPGVRYRCVMTTFVRKPSPRAPTRR